MGGKRGIFAKPAAVLLALFLFVLPASAFGEVSDFLPTIYSSQGDFGLTMMRQSSVNSAGVHGTRSSDMFATEQLKLYLDGYAYDPRFVQFLVKGAAGLSQERYDSNFGGSYSNEALATAYEFRTKFLAGHPYNLELYTLNETPLLQRHASTETRSTNTEQGAVFNYAKTPVIFNMGHITGGTRTRVSSDEYRTSHINGSVSTGPFSSIAVYSHADASTSAGTHATSDNSHFGNSIKLSSYSLESRVSDNHLKQFSPLSADLDTTVFTWTEQFNAALPWNFSTSASYNFQKNVRTSEQTAVELRKREANETESSGFILAHKLYDSVRTTYGWNETSSESSFGTTQSESHSLHGVYTKKLPDGRVTISGQAGYSIVDQVNAPLIVDETYIARLIDTFTLSRENIDPSSISVKVRTDTGILVDLTQNTHYVVEPAGNLVKITIVALPPQVSAGYPISHEYSFQVTYTLMARTAELEIASLMYSMNLSLFNNLVNPYYSRQYTSQAVLTGSVPGGNQDTDTKIIGVTIQKAPYALTTEERTTENPASPSRSLRNAAEFSQKMSDTLNLASRVENTKTIYGEGTMGSRGYTERVSVLNVMISKNVPQKKLIVTLGSTYSQREAIMDTELYTLRGSLLWRQGAFSVSMEASISRSESTGSSMKQTMVSDLYYLTVSRRLF